MSATDGDTVQVHYKGTLDDGQVFDQSEGRGPIEFTIGAGQVVPGFDAGVRGMAVGDKKSIEIAPADAYGERDERMVRNVPRSDVNVDDLQPGHVLQLQSPEGQMFQGIVTEIADEEVTLDFNHFLAGKTLRFELELVAINAESDNEEE